jgi:hypothetical protein
MRRYRLDKGWPHLAKKLKAPGFHELGEDERREIFRGLVALGGDKADSVLFELIAKGTLLPSSSREVSRALAVEAVGDFSVSAQTEASLRQALDEGVRGSEELRQGVQGALAKIAARRALASGVGRPS